jgi:hypothetical protein
MFKVFQLFQMYVSIVSCGCCKSRSGCCICCNGCTRVLQASIPNVSSIFCTCILHVFHLSSFVYCNCCISMFLKVNRDVCTCCNGVSIVCPKRFIYFRRMLQRSYLNVAKIDLVFECSSGTHLPTYLQLLGPRACVWERRGTSGRHGKQEWA